MKVVITGGTGLIGRPLVASLANDQHTVIVLSRNPDQAAQAMPGVSLVKWDAQSSDGWLEHVEGADAIVNLAGENIAGEGFPPTRWTSRRKALILESRVNAGKAVVEAVEKAVQKPRVLIQASAIGYYADTGAQPIDETGPSGEDFQARVSVEWEAATAPVEAMGVRRVVIRSGVVLSTDGGAFASLLIPFKMVVAGGPIGSGQQYFSWIHIQDEVRAIRFLIENPATQGVYNLTAPHPVTNAAFARIIGKAMGRPSFMPTPGPALRLALGEVASVVLDGHNVLPRRLQEAGFEFTFSDPQSAVHDLLKRR